MNKLNVELNKAQMNLIKEALIAKAASKPAAIRDRFYKEQVQPILDAMEQATRD